MTINNTIDNLLSTYKMVNNDNYIDILKHW